MRSLSGKYDRNIQVGEQLVIEILGFGHGVGCLGLRGRRREGSRGADCPKNGARKNGASQKEVEENKVRKKEERRLDRCLINDTRIARESI
jgi:hypothetical protein